MASNGTGTGPDGKDGDGIGRRIDRVFRVVVHALVIPFAEMVIIGVALLAGAGMVLGPVFASRPHSDMSIAIPTAVVYGVSLLAYAVVGAVGAWAGVRPGMRVRVRPVVLITAVALTVLQHGRFAPMLSDVSPRLTWWALYAISFALPLWLARRYTVPATT